MWRQVAIVMFCVWRDFGVTLRRQVVFRGSGFSRASIMQPIHLSSSGTPFANDHGMRQPPERDQWNLTRLACRSLDFSAAKIRLAQSGTKLGVHTRSGLIAG
ncbi:hypothetical protein ACVILL_005749 [Bradyrhizobium sp. USDA 3364]